MFCHLSNNIVKQLFFFSVKLDDVKCEVVIVGSPNEVESARSDVALIAAVHQVKLPLIIRYHTVYLNLVRQFV